MATPPDSAHQVAVTIAEAAGRLLRHAWRENVEVMAKGTGGDVITELDVAAENLIVARLAETFPGHRIIAEESGLRGAADSYWTWLIDPLDGTNNVAIGLPAYVVGIALCADGIPVLGVVHEPVLGQTWSAIRGRGAHGPNGKPLRPAKRQVTPTRILAWTQGYSVARDDRTAGALKTALEAASHRLLQLWAPLLSWVMLSRGVIDGIVGYRPEEIDLPAGALIASEAGAEIRTLDGEPFTGRIGQPPEERSFVAGRPAAIGSLLELVRRSRQQQNAD